MSDQSGLRGSRACPGWAVPGQECHRGAATSAGQEGAPGAQGDTATAAVPAPGDGGTGWQLTKPQLVGLSWRQESAVPGVWVARGVLTPCARAEMSCPGASWLTLWVSSQAGQCSGLLQPGSGPSGPPSPLSAPTARPCSAAAGRKMNALSAEHLPGGHFPTRQEGS